jgi:hypothetical protein
MMAPPNNLSVPYKKYKFIMAVIGVPIFFGAAVVGLIQTSAYGRFLTGPNGDEIKKHIKASKQRQEARLESYKKKENRDVPSGIQYEMFTPAVAEHLKAIVDGFLQDNDLQRELKEEFGINFNEISVAVIPSWAIEGPETVLDNLNAGITSDGWRQARNARKSDYVDGYTLRERPESDWITLDGRPRVVLNSSAFSSENGLHLALFHELLHCLNIEGSNPPWYCFAQDDLRYLGKYREEVSRHQWILSTEILKWALAVILPFGLGCAEVKYVYGHLRSRRQR